MEELKQLLEMTELIGPSGHEREVARYIEEKLSKAGYEIKHDNLGNLICSKPSAINNAPTLALFAHMDEVGYLVKEIAKDGTIKGYMLGGINTDILPSNRLKLKTEDGKIYKGMIRAIPPHLKEVAKDNKEFIFDFGFTSDEEVKASGIEVGNPIVFDEPSLLIAQDKSIMAKALDDRAGCSALLSTALFAASLKLDYNLTFVFTTQEEVGLRGATVAVNSVSPTLAVVSDISPTMKEYGHRSKGVLIRHADRNMVSFPRLISYQKELFTENNIAFQDYISLGGTDAGAIHTSLEGIPTLTMCLVADSIHGPSSIVDVSDYEELLKGLKALVSTLDGATIRRLQNHD